MNAPFYTYKLFRKAPKKVKNVLGISKFDDSANKFIHSHGEGYRRQLTDPISVETIFDPVMKHKKAALDKNKKLYQELNKGRTRIHYEDPLKQEIKKLEREIGDGEKVLNDYNKMRKRLIGTSLGIQGTALGTSVGVAASLKSPSEEEQNIKNLKGKRHE